MSAAEPFPSQIDPMLAKMGPVPEGEEWGYEIKWDGVRALGYADGGEWRMTNRRGIQIGERYPELAPLADALGERTAVLDGEVVAFDDEGKPSFQRIQRRMGLTAPASVKQRITDTPVTFFVFDLLHLDGASTRELPYTERREMLDGLEIEGANWRAPLSHTGPGADLFEAARQQGLEGVVAKRLDSPYRPGRRSGEWIKTRIWRRQEFVIGGWLPGEGSRSGRVGSLLVGYYGDAGLTFAGGVGSGLREGDIDALTETLKSIERPATPFMGRIPGRSRGRQPRWAEPVLVCEVSFTEWTTGGTGREAEDPPLMRGTLRQPSFKGMRDDKDPSTVVRED